MAVVAPLRRFIALARRDKTLLAEAVVTLAYSSALIAAFPFRRVVDLAQSPVRPPRPGTETDVRRLKWAVEAARRRVPWKAVCIQSALCLHLMLGRRGIASTLHYGIASSPDQALKAHVWLSLGDEILLGGREAPDFALVASFPAKLA